MTSKKDSILPSLLQYEAVFVLVMATLAVRLIFLRLVADSSTPTLVLGAIALTVALGLAFASAAACLGRVAGAGR